ncbi:hypothetical protein COU57_01430 [Candidatus Pacearchaeota archaeon CG10_big_fil_rev_8_21_14_0_10_32_14]|nr:MAG: hypothetical protein COU57_01430 [Candidatus Pacearchaeota archaeon CG10_big_fil_rev_8_21_14_0_10_32_14]
MKDDSVFLKHILENIDDISEFTKNITKKDFLSNKEKQNAVVRSLEVIGEAAKNISETMKEKYPKVPWKEIIGTRDKIIHHYFGVDLDIVWDIIKINLPDLNKNIKKIITELEIM